MARRRHSYLAGALILALSGAQAASDGLGQARKLILRKQFRQAAELLTPEAQRGQAEACWMLSALYRKGQGVPRSPGQAFRYLECAAKGGKVTAMRLTGIALMKGEGVKKDVAAGRRWLERAAAAGDVTAQAYLESTLQPQWPDEYGALVKALETVPAEQISDLPRERLNQKSRAGEGLLWPFVRTHDWLRAGQLLALGLDIGQSRKDGRTLLHDRVLANDWEAVRWLLRRHAPVAAKDAQGNTALHLAVKQSDQVVLPELIVGDALNAVNLSGDTPLDVAAKAGRAHWIARLKAAGGKRLNGVRDTEQFTDRALAAQARQAGLPLIHYAAQTGALDWLKRQSPRDWHAKDPEGMTPLMRAIEGAQWHTAQWLVGHLASLTEEEVQWIDKVMAAQEVPLAIKMIERLPDEAAALRVLPLALKLRDGEVYDALMKRISVKGASPRLLLAAARGHAWAVVHQWIAHARPVVFDAQHRHALWYALEAGEWDAARALIGAGQNPLESDAFGQTGLHAWVGRGMPGSANMLDLPGISADSVTTTGGQTLLMTAVLAHRPEGVTRLLKAGADVHARDAQGNTALILAVREQQTAIVRRLLEAGARPGQRNRNKQSAVNIAEQMGNSELIEMLKAADTNRSWF